MQGPFCWFRFTCDGDCLRLGWNHPEVHQVVPEGFGRRSKAETLARGTVETVAEGGHLTVRQSEDNHVQRQIAAHAFVHVLDRALLPRGLRIAEPGLCTEAVLKLSPRHKFQPAVEGQAAARTLGQGRHQTDKPVHDRLRTTVVVAKQNGEAGLALDQGGHIGRAMLFAEDHQICLPMPEFFARCDDCGPMADR